MRPRTSYSCPVYDFSATPALVTTEPPPLNASAIPEDTLTLNSDSATTATTSSYSGIVTSRSTDDSTTPIDNTLSMISTPWDTESWYTDTDSDCFVCDDFSLSTFTLFPNTTTSEGWSCLTVLSSSNITLTLFNGADSASVLSTSVRPLAKRSGTYVSDTISSWTLESFTSTGCASDSEHVKARYPWSPETTISGTDFYPNTRTTSNHSGASVATEGMSPLKYIDLSNKHNDPIHPILDWMKKQKLTPLN